MIWKKTHPDEVGESLLVCTATAYAEIAYAVRELIERLTADWLALGQTKAEETGIEEDYVFYEKFAVSSSAERLIV